MLRKAMLSKGARYEMVVDNIASRENVTRYAQHQGYAVSMEKVFRGRTPWRRTAGSTP